MKTNPAVPHGRWSYWMESDDNDPDDSEYVVGVPLIRVNGKSEIDNEHTVDLGSPGQWRSVAEAVPNEATAKLLCAAPDLRDALAELLAYFDTSSTTAQQIADRAREALAKAGAK